MNCKYDHVIQAKKRTVCISKEDIQKVVQAKKSI